ncbi:hypothetical protein EPD60_09790 [Flaviaesturariibacter flavus]|uniref:Uncharacterized protein n=1 Tax=Flaviaesturariibacter flavus TaxID=2502780 RepID=A0A4R1BBD1_9BACT|nr:hypothetical protein [Flaviaesturariibacter flavus]TCJ14283.1 hypothetical protein EPD60_09790 [Flaviaesturariibacter flavus]
MALKKRIAALASAVLLVLLIVSCQKEISTEGLATVPGSGNGNPALPANRRCVSCTFLPLCDSSEFTYLLDGTDTSTGIIHLGTDTVVNGQTFSRVGGFAAFNGGIMYSCANQEYKLALPLSQFGLNPDTLRALLQPALDSLLPVPGAGINIPNTFYATILKAGQGAGTTWLDTLVTVNVPFTQGTTTVNLRLFAGIEYTYLGKDISYSVLGTNYTNVQRVQGKPKIGLAGASAGQLPLTIPDVEGQVDFYFAGNIGLIEMNAADSTGLVSSAKLVRYRL